VAKLYGIVPGTDAPPIPLNLVAEFVTAGYVSLSWDTSAGAVRYQVYRNGLPIGQTLTDTITVDSSVVPETTYSYRVQAFSETAASELSDELAVTTSVNSLPVWELTDQTGTLGHFVSLDLRTVCDDPDTHALTFTLPSGSVPGLSLDSPFYTGTPTAVGAFPLTFRANDGYGTSDISLTFNVSDPDVTAPSAPTNVVATANGSTVLVTWEASTDPSGIASYRIRRDDVFRASVAGDLLSYSESGLPDGTYVYQIRAVDGSANANTSVSSTATPASTVTINTVVVVPDVPTNLEVVAASTSQLDVSWAAGPNGATPTGYRLQRATSLAGPYSTVYEGAGTNYSDTGLAASTTRYYKVLAKNGVNESSYSTPVSGTTQTDSTGIADFIIPASSAARTISNATTTAYTGTTWASLATGSKTRPQAGDIIELAAGTHGKLTLTINGSSSGNITLRANQSARSIVSVATTFVLTVQSCTYLTIDGGMIGSQYGLLVTAPSASSGVGHFIKYAGFNHHVTLKNFEVDGKITNFSAVTGVPIGVGLHDNTLLRTAYPGVFQQHDNVVENFYVHRVKGEGIYGGPNFSTGACPLKNMTIRNGVIEDTGRDAIQVKCWFEGTNKIYSIRGRRIGLNPDDEAGQRYGVSVLSGQADVYDIDIDGVGETGIQFYTQAGPDANITFNGYGPYTTFASKCYNVLIANAGQIDTGTVNIGHGVAVGTDNSARVKTTPQIFNITAVNCEGYGVNLGVASGGFLRNCVLLGNGSGAYNLGGGGTTQSNNKTTGSLTATYRLTAEDAASGTIGIDISVTDLDGISRSGTASKGAYEFV